VKYQSGRPGRIFIARFEDEDDVLAGLEQIVRENDVQAAHVVLVGGMRAGDFVVGPEEETFPPKPMWRKLAESHETLGVGTIFWDDKKPRVHLHGAFGKADSVKVGCLRDHSRAFLVLEAIVTEIDGVAIRRALDPVSGMVLLRIED